MIDILRRLALFGVLMVNLLTAFRVPLLEHILRPHTHPGRANHLVDLLVAGALEFKALTIFSFLFGVGIAIQLSVRRPAALFKRGRGECLTMSWNWENYLRPQPGSMAASTSKLAHLLNRLEKECRHRAEVFKASSEVISEEASI